MEKHVFSGASSVPGTLAEDPSGVRTHGTSVEWIAPESETARSLRLRQQLHAGDPKLVVAVS